MSVLMTMRITGDPTKLEAQDSATMAQISARAKEHGLTYHRFFGTDKEILVVDEWPDEASFKAFFDASPEIPELMAQAGVTSQPETVFWRELDTGDAVG